MEEGLQLNISQFLINRVASETKRLTMSAIEKEYILSIFDEDSYLNEKFPEIEQVANSIKLLDNNFFYDIYKFSYDNLSYAIKIEESSNSFIFNNERDALESLKGLNLSPLFFNTGSSENYSYFLTSYENSMSSKQLGLSHFYENIDVFASTLAKIHNATKQENNKMEYFVDSTLSFGSFEEILDPESYEGLMETKFFKKGLLLLDEIKKSINIQKTQLVEVCSCLCHTDINLSSILNREGKMKICNFYQSSIIHPAWDLAFASYKLELDQHPITEKKFLEAYHAESFLKEDEYSYTYFKQMVYKIMLYKLVCGYFHKICLQEEASGGAIMFFQNYALIRESVLDEFSESMDMLDEMFCPNIKDL